MVQYPLYHFIKRKSYLEYEFENLIKSNHNKKRRNRQKIFYKCQICREPKPKPNASKLCKECATYKMTKFKEEF